MSKTTVVRLAAPYKKGAAGDVIELPWQEASNLVHRGLAQRAEDAQSTPATGDVNAGAAPPANETDAASGVESSATGSGSAAKKGK